MNNKLISVIVLVYNTAEYLNDCFDSLLNQTYQNIEIIAINDCSPDNSQRIMEYYDQNFDNFKPIYLEQNVGGAEAYNIALQHAKGEYLIIMDGDDFRPLDSIELLYNKAEEHKADIVIGRPLVYQNGKFSEHTYVYETKVWERERTFTTIDKYYDVLYDPFYWNKIMKMDFVRKNGINMKNGLLYADRPMMHKAYIHAKKIHITTETVYYWRKRDVDSVQSIIQDRVSLANLKDRFDSILGEYDDLVKYKNNELTEACLSRMIDRILFMFPAVIDDEEARNYILKEARRLLQYMNNPYQNDLPQFKNLLIYGILKEDMYLILSLIKNRPRGEVFYKTGTYYFNTQYYNAESVILPEELFAINNTIEEGTVKIDKLEVKKNHLIIKNMFIPINKNIRNVELELIKGNDFSTRFVFDYKNELSHHKNFDMDIDLKDVPYDFYKLELVVNYEDKSFDRISLRPSAITTDSELLQSNKSIKKDYTFSKNFLYLNYRNKKGKPSIRIEDKKIIIEGYQEEFYRFYLKARKSSKKVYFEQDNTLSLDDFVHNKSLIYDLSCEVYDNYFRTSIKTLKIQNDNKKLNIPSLKKQIKIYKTNKDNISFRFTRQK